MAAGWFEYLKLSFLSKPTEDRQLYRLIKRRGSLRIVELGMGSVDRAESLIRVCQRFANKNHVEAKVYYAGLDWFEERTGDMPAVSLIDAHRRLKAAGAEVRLMPGGPTAGLPAVANALAGTDLVLVSPMVDEQSLANAAFYLPRMCHAGTQVLRCESDGETSSWNAISIEEIAASTTQRRAA